MGSWGAAASVDLALDGGWEPWGPRRPWELISGDQERVLVQ